MDVLFFIFILPLMKPFVPDYHSHVVLMDVVSIQDGFVMMIMIV